MFRIMGSLPTIRKSADKTEWRAQMDQLVALRIGGTIGEVIDLLKSTQRPRLTDRVTKRESEITALGPNETPDESNSLKRHRALRNVAYRELVALVEFIDGFTPFATQHSVKGAQFENVLVILSAGWSHYNWPKFLESLQAENIPSRDQASFARWRNLFYVAISRPKKRLAILATQTLGPQALAAAAHLFGAENVVSLPMPPEPT